jgi:hypothetical protein
MGGQKFVSVTPLGEVIPLNSPADRSSTTRQLTFTFSTRIQTDSLGRIYSNGSGTLRRSGQPSLSLDSTAIIRFDPRSGATDTIAFIPTTAGSSGSARAGAGSRAATIPSPASADARVPYRASAAWVVARDGSVAIIKPEPFTLEWIAPDGRGSGPRQLSHQPVRITDAEKEEELNPRVEQRGGCDMSVQRDLADGAIGTFRRSFALPISAARPSISWPEFKHPYTNDDNAIVATEASEIMVLASRSANDPVPRYDVYDRDGALVRRVRLPPGTRMLGLGRGFIYLARNDQDGLQYLSRHRLAR